MSTRSCEICGSSLTWPGVGRPPSKFCSRTCKERARTLARQAAIAKEREGRTCRFCGGPIPDAMNARALSCSEVCSWKWSNVQRAAAKKAERHATKGPCRECGGEIPDARRSNSLYCSAKCKKNAIAARWRERAPHYMRRYLYGITPDQYIAMIAAQENRCAICGSSEWPGKHPGVPQVDHNHRTNVVRELLCGTCNTGLGQFDEDPIRLRAAALYLEKHNSTT